MTSRRQARPGTTSRVLRHAVWSVHVFAFAYIAFQSNYLGNERRTLAIGFLVGQCSVLTVIATLGYVDRWRSVLMPWLVGGITWFGISRVFMWGSDEEISVTWLFGIIVTVLITIAVVRLLDVCVLASAASGNSDLITPKRFLLSTLMIWTTIAAVLFAIPSFGQRLRLWDTTAIDGQMLSLMLCVGIAFAVTSAACVWSVAKPRPLSVVLRLSVAALFTAAVAITMHRIAEAFGSPGGPKPTSELRVFGAHATTVALTMLLAGYCPSQHSTQPVASTDPADASSTERESAINPQGR